jgi:hypothetical protein
MKTFFLLSLLALSHLVFGQNRTVVFDYERSYFDNDQPLPAATNFTITGPISEQVTMVEVKIYTDKPKEHESPLYQSLWKTNSPGKSQNFFLPVNLKLRSTDYDLVVNYYRGVDENEIQNIRQDLFAALDIYLEQSLLNKPTTRLFKKTHENIGDLNSIVNSSLFYYKNSKGIKFIGFSDIIREKIKFIKSSRTKTAKNLYPDLNRDQALMKYRQQQVDELKQQVHNEAAYLLNMGLSVLADSRYVDNYPVERTKNIFTIHGGYAGVYLGGGDDDLSYGSGVMAGVTLPLGKKAYTSKFWSNSAIIAGFFFTDFEDDNDIKVSGPIFKRPTYVGLGYKVFNFIRLSAGATFLENQKTAGNLGDLENTVFIRPFIGLQVDLNLWMDLAK